MADPLAPPLAQRLIASIPWIRLSTGTGNGSGSLWIPSEHPLLIEFLTICFYLK